jgi:hypothetical protein
LAPEKEAYMNYDLSAWKRGKDDPPEPPKRPSTAQRKEKEEKPEEEKKPKSVRPATAKDVQKTEVPEGYLKTYLDGIMGPPTYIPKECQYMGTDRQGKPVLRLNLSDPSKFLQGKKGE